RPPHPRPARRPDVRLPHMQTRRPRPNCTGALPGVHQFHPPRPRTHLPVQGLLLTETAGTWATGVAASLPANAGSNPAVSLFSVSCASAGNCGAVGSYDDSSGNTQGLLLRTVRRLTVLKKGSGRGSVTSSPVG